MGERDVDGVRCRACARRQQRVQQLELTSGVADGRAGDEQLKRGVEVGLRRPAREQHARDLDDRGRHRRVRSRVERDEPKQLRIEEVLLAPALAVARRLQGALVHEPGVIVEQSLEPPGVASPDRCHGGAERRVAQHRTVEQLGDRLAIGRHARASGFERAASRAVRRPLHRPMPDQQLDEREWASLSGGVEWRRVAMPRVGPGLEQRRRDGDPVGVWGIAQTRLLKRRGLARRRVDRLARRDQASDRLDITGSRCQSRVENGATRASYTLAPQAHRAQRIAARHGHER